MIHRTDDNQLEILEFMRTIPGLTWRFTTQVNNFVDVVAGWKGINYLWEIKSEKGKLSKSQKEFHDWWSGEITVIKTIDDVLKALGIKTQ